MKNLILGIVGFVFGCVLVHFFTGHDFCLTQSCMDRATDKDICNLIEIEQRKPIARTVIMDSFFNEERKKHHCKEWTGPKIVRSYKDSIAQNRGGGQEFDTIRKAAFLLSHPPPCGTRRIWIDTIIKADNRNQKDTITIFIGSQWDSWPTAGRL